MTNLTITNFIKILGLSCRFSHAITKSLIDSNILKFIDGLIPSQEDQRKQHYSVDQFPFIIDAICNHYLIFMN